jgi:monothiol glutaredoxin
MNINEQIKEQIDNNDVVLYMKGNKASPQCGFSNMISRMLTVLNVEYKDIDVLASEDIRQGIKEFSDWPTIPQLYIKGEFVGGCDIVRDMYSDGSLFEMLDEKEIDYTK